ncbi:velvet factor, partial [Chytriomyces sp. MP71]
LTVVQQPVRGRVSGISSSDRRPIHPPPINLQQNMTYSTKTSDPVVRYKLNSDKNEPSLEEGPASKRAKYTVSTTTAYINNQVLLGQLVAISTPLMDLDHERGFFFIYPELSVRTSGKLRLRFDLFEMVAGASGKRSPLATCFSDVFQVYNPKEYPGITQSTALTACFARQGIKMRVRSGDERKRRAEDDSEDD